MEPQRQGAAALSDLARLRIWDDPAIRDSLSWYLAVAENRRPAKFRIAAILPTQLDPATSGEEALWAELDRLTPIFSEGGRRSGQARHCRRQRTGRACSSCAASLPIGCSPTVISVRGIAASTVSRPRNSALAFASRVSSHFHQTGEELFYRGTEGSGAIFFTSCNMRCALCLPLRC